MIAAVPKLVGRLPSPGAGVSFKSQFVDVMFASDLNVMLGVDLEAVCEEQRWQSPTRQESPATRGLLNSFPFLVCSNVEEEVSVDLLNMSSLFDKEIKR